MKNIFLEIESNRKEIPSVESILIKLNSEFGLDEERFINFQIAVSEALVNAIVHGNKLDSGKKVHINILVEEKKMTVKIKDEGEGFDFNSLPDPTIGDNIYKEHGRGIFIIKSLVDEFIWTSDREGTEMILTVFK